MNIDVLAKSLFLTQRRKARKGNLLLLKKNFCVLAALRDIFDFFTKSSILS